MRRTWSGIRIHDPRIVVYENCPRSLIRPIQGILVPPSLGDGIVDTSSSMAVISPQHDLALTISASDGDLQANHLICGEVQEGELVR